MNSRCLSAGAALRLLVLLALLLLPALPARAALDVNSDSVPDIWAMFYSAGALPMGADPDGDGLTTAQEAAAGTDPRSPGSIVKITAISLDAAGLHLTFPSQAGKQYQVQSSASLATPNWQPAGSPHAGTGADVSTVLPAADATEKFYRVLVLDTDSDGDGVTDWEELTLGFDPTSSHSSGLSGVDDRTAITQGLQSPNTVTIAARDSAASEAGPDTGTIVVNRAGNFSPITVRYSVSGTATAGDDYTALSGTVALPIGVRAATITVTPVADPVSAPKAESNEAVIVSLTADPAYSIGSPTVATVIISDAVQANGTGLTAEFFNEATTGGAAPSTTVAPQMTTLVLHRDGLNGRPAPDVTVNYDYLVAPWPGSPVRVTHFASRWSGEIVPEFSQIYTFFANVNTGGRLWVNGKLLVNNWPRTGYTVASNEYSGTIELSAGVRYPIVFEHYEISGNNAKAILSWQSANQAKQVIPTNRLFANAAPQITSELEVLLLKNSGPFTYQIAASGRATGFSAANLPPGWSFNAATGAISGSPAQAGVWEIPISATNAHGSGSAVLTLTVIETGGGITRDLWTNVAGDSVSQIPLLTTPTSTSVLAILEGPQNAADNYGARIRGYLTAPATGVYKFWLTADQTAELWISDDEEAINAFKRAEVLAPTGYRAWAEAGAGKSPLLWLVAGQRYLVEVRHKEGAGTDHVSVGWLKPGQSVDPANATAPSEVVPAYALSPYVAPAPVSGQTTLFTTNMTSQGGAVTSGYGTSSLQLSADETQAILRFNYANLSTPVAAKHIHMDAWNGHPQGEIVYDIDDFQPRADGSYVWEIEPVGTYQNTADILAAIKAGVAYINIHTANYPNGEIRGNYRLQAGSATFTPPAAAPSWTDDHADANAAARFLTQTTFGVSGADADADTMPDAIEQVQSLGYEAWIDAQLAIAPTLAYPYVFTNRNLTNPSGPTYPGSLMFNSWWKNAVTAPDQLRQRVAFALSEIMVISEAGPLDDRAEAVSDFYDMLLHYGLGNAAFTPGAGQPSADGNFLNLLKAVTLHPAMGRYLDMLNNRKPNIPTGRIPNENYAREILQLFSIGLNRMWPDGSLMLNSKGEPIPTYDQDAIIGFAHAFTGWGYNYTGAYRTTLPGTSNWIDPMREVPLEHYTGHKRLLNNVVLPGLATVAGQPLDPNASHSAAQYNDTAYQALAAQELDATHRQIFNHPNTGPFICRQLIQRLVTSTPSRGYLYRVVQKFNDNGAGVRGDMKAVVKAILLDYEARSPVLLSQQGFGKQREPVSRVAAMARAFPAPAAVNGTYSQTGNLITVSLTPAQTFSNGSNLYLDFSGGTPSDPDDAPYSVSSVSTSGNTTTFTVRPRSTEGSTGYTQANATLTVTFPTNSDHAFNTTTNNQAYLDFTAGTPDAPADGVFTVTSVTSDELVFTVPAPGAKLATYSQTTGANVITVTVPAGHTNVIGDVVRIDFVTGSPSAAASAEYAVAAVNGNTFTIAYPADAIARSGTAHVILPAASVSRTGTVVASRASYSVDRSGTVAATYSDWNMDSTDTDLNQTPMRAPTVFNFFEPDYSYPGALAQAGLITPEFQITSDTSVMRQANFLYNGIFNDLHSTQGLSSFRSGGRDIALDFRRWMGAGPGGLPWAHNNNVGALIDKLNTLLLAGQLPSSGTNAISGNTRTIVNAKQVVADYVTALPYNKAITAISGTTPTTITLGSAHGLTTGQSVTISGVTGGSFSAPINGTHTVTVTGTSTFAIPITRNNSTGLNLANAIVAPSTGFPDLLRDRVRAVVHLLVTSPDFTIQK